MCFIMKSKDHTLMKSNEVAINQERPLLFVCLFVCLSGRPLKGEVGVPWHLKPGIQPHVQGPGV